MTHGPHDQPSDVSAEEGEVHLDGPGATALSMTPEAAIETADRLNDHAVIALGQAKMKAIRDDEMRRLRG